jgi:hypothetical protein
MKTTVIERIKLISNEKEVSYRQFALKIEFNYNTLNNYVIEKTKTIDLELIIKILTTYPDISPEWLIMGQGTMYKNGTTTTVAIDNDGILMKTIIDLSGQVAILKERVKQLEEQETAGYNVAATPILKYGKQ